MPLTQSPRVALIDLGNVIVGFDHHRGALQIAALEGVNKHPDEIFKFLVGGPDCEGVNKSYELGHISTDELWDQSRRALELQCAREDFERGWSDIFWPIHETMEFLNQLSEKCPLYLCSNTNPLHWHHVMNLVPGVEKLFEKLFLSYEMNLLKPDEAYFHHIVENLKVKPEECLFLDDMEPNIRAAERVGINAIQFTSVDHVRKSLNLRA